MTSNLESLRAFLDAAPAAALIEVAEAKGSTPREKGAWMLVSPDAIFGTIGGGQLEFMAISEAREVLSAEFRDAPSSGLASLGHLLPEGRRGSATQRQESPLPGGERVARAKPEPEPGEGAWVLDIPLGPEIGQCCGGRVELSIRRVDAHLRAQVEDRAREQDMQRPHVLVFGGGHVGHALAAALALLPVQAIVVETRAEALEDMPSDTETRLTAVPEEMVREAPPGSAFVVLTHDHALDFLIMAEALRREDAAYVGMIGSKTKKATFKSWFLKNGGTEEIYRRLVCPIGGEKVRDKRPAVIAALAAAEIMTAFASESAP